MRSSDAAGRVALANFALASMGAKGHLGPRIGGGASSIGAAAARAAGITVDPNGRLRCPPGGPSAEEFTDMQMSNCITESPTEVAVDVVRGLARIPSKMRKIRNLSPRYRPQRVVSTPLGFNAVDEADAHRQWAERLDNGMPVEGVPDAYLWGAIVTSFKGGSGRFEIEKLANNDVVDSSGDIVPTGVNDTALVTDTLTGRVMITKREVAYEEAPYVELLTHRMANELGLPVSEFRIANGARAWNDIVTIQSHVNQGLFSEVIRPQEVPDPDGFGSGDYDPVGTFGRPVPHNVDNLATLTAFDWVTANGDRHSQNMFVTLSAEGEAHVVPIDHGFSLDDGYDTPFTKEEYLAWMMHDDLGGLYNPGLGFVLAEQETQGFATRDETLDALESARDRITNLNIDDIHEAVVDSFPEGYDHQNLGRALTMVQERIAILSGVTRKDFDRMLNRMQSGEATRGWADTPARNIRMYATGVVVPHDASVLDMTEDVHGVRQPNGVLVRGIPLAHDDPDIPDRLFHVGGLPDGAKGAGVAAPDDGGDFVGFVELQETEEAANIRLGDITLYRELAQAWEADDFERAFEALKVSSRTGGGWSALPRDDVVDYWNDDDPMGLLSAHFGNRLTETGIDKPRLPRKRTDFARAASEDPPAIMTVSKSKLNTRAMITDTPTGIRVYGHVKYSSASRNPVRPKPVSAVREPVRRPLDIPTPDDLGGIHDVFKARNKKLFLVGGAVRDAMMGRDPKDFDLATDATPDEVIAMLRASDPSLQIDLTGADFAVVRVRIPGGSEYEIATFRTDVGEGRRPDGGVRLATIQEDVARRDLTMNALFYDLDSREVVDYVGGMSDIDNGVIKAVGDPAERFREDKLRILRAVRFSGRTGFDLDDATKEAILSDGDLTGVSAERVHDEFLSGLKSARDPQAFMQLIGELNLWPQVFQSPEGVGDLSVDVSRSVDSNNPSVQIAAILGQNDVSDIANVLKHMKYQNSEIADVKMLVNMKSLSSTTAPELKKAFGKRDISEADLLAFSGSLDMPESEIQAFLAFTRAPQAVSSQELIDRGFKGPALGKAIEAAEASAYRSFRKNPSRKVRTRNMSLTEERAFTDEGGNELVLRVEDARSAGGFDTLRAFSATDREATPAIVARNSDGTIVGRIVFSEQSMSPWQHPVSDGRPVTLISSISALGGNGDQSTVAEMLRMLSDKTNDPIDISTVTDNSRGVLSALGAELGDRYSLSLDRLLVAG